MTAPPQVPQHIEALALGNSIRKANAGLKAEIAAVSPRIGAEWVADIVERDYADRTIGAMYADSLLMSVQHLGISKAEKCLSAAGLQIHHRRLRSLTPRQRSAIAAQLRLWGAGYR